MEKRSNGGIEAQGDLRHGAEGPGPNGQEGEPPEPLPQGKVLASRSPTSVVRLALLFYLPLALAGLAWRVLLAGEPILYASARAQVAGLHPLRDLAAGLLAAGLTVLVSWEFTRRTRAGEALARSLASALGELSLRQCVILALLSGIGEEIFFRGALQPRVGLWAASLLFGLAHFVPRRELLPWTAFSIGAGLLLGALFEATGNLVAPIAAHATVNAVNLRLLVRRYGASGAGEAGR